MIEMPKAAANQAKPGSVLKGLRLKRGLTLAEVSAATGLPVSTLSKVENDKMALSFDKLMRISQGLKIDISVLFGDSKSEDAAGAATGRRSIARAGDAKTIETEHYISMFPASDLLNKRMVPIIAEVHARSLEEFGDFIQHPGEEYGYVLEGEAELHTSLYAPLHLKTGDSVYFDSSMGHAYIAVGEATCKILSICTRTEPELISQLDALRGAPATPAEPRLARVRS